MRIAVISDIHGDLDSLRRVLTAIEGAATDQSWCLGDIVGLGATAPAEVVDLRPVITPNTSGGTG